jgi:hypothetical protein
MASQQSGGGANASSGPSRSPSLQAGTGAGVAGLTRR